MLAASPLSEKEALAKISGEKALYAPLSVESIEALPAAPLGRLDAAITLAWRGRKVRFLAEIKSRTAPRMVAESLWRLKRIGGRGRNLLLVVPYLSKTIVELISQEGISALDLSGNYYIQAPGLVAVRLDQPNRYPESQPIKRIFSANSSMVARRFLAKGGRFKSVNEVRAGIQALGGSLSLSAVSKVLKGLSEELMIEKGGAAGSRCSSPSGCWRGF